MSLLALLSSSPRAGAVTATLRFHLRSQAVLTSTLRSLHTTSHEAPTAQSTLFTVPHRPDDASPKATKLDDYHAKQKKLEKAFLEAKRRIKEMDRDLDAAIHEIRHRQRRTEEEHTHGPVWWSEPESQYDVRMEVQDGMEAVEGVLEGAMKAGREVEQGNIMDARGASGGGVRKGKGKEEDLGPNVIEQ
ncbi:hypothetical protein SAICODRAFT_4150 [Saitoella complicata NRRL Y-17804]|uniref:Uncharacterized protein n=1 Tax=Saitoella complicata (strain BCRC 22490 / CBS 7301 / JCM 7358 / NBRC 10748 / NRRL Y-17804) TaxID=698492 RepID=A0A0E9NNN8_SAICN|nr:uncharacterized protein SAICODRAFT_4150 [Saitoella complicata NRRL Y-17804]ODQ55930.1 hypothetical protein SAICODRAFT_4150 [Saitoella complicata NRRL Y-17804]GAO51487.1 hypothetical protein G7K_5587-t1 [Saitoella complicata NRRL Y-17804]